MIRLILADDHDLFLEGLHRMISAEESLYLSGVARNGTEVIKMLKSSPCDVIVMDVDMPEMDGIEATRLIKQKYPEVRVLILSMHNKSIVIKKLVDLGVDGYLLKNTSFAQLTEAIRSIGEGNNYFDQSVMEKMMEWMRKKDDHSIRLTRRELEVLALLAQGKRTKDIAEELHVSTHTIDTHRKNLLSKAGVNNSIELLKWAKENEYIK